MRNLASLCLASFIALLPFHVSAEGAKAQAKEIVKDVIDCRPSHKELDEEGFVSIGGIEQWVTVKGNDCANPVILMVHGGPGNPTTLYADAPYHAWEKDFTLVQWDQRGAGKTYGRNPVDPETPETVLTIERMAADGTELTAYMVRHLKTKKIILFGGSWGTVLAVHMAKTRPDLFVAYVGTGQMVSHKENDVASYRKLIELARAAGDAKTLQTIEALGEPPWTDPRALGILRRATRTYEAKTSTAAPQSWWQPSPQYSTEKLQADYESGEEFSWLQFVGLKGNGMLATLDLPKLGFDFQIPVFLVQGTEDLVTVPEVAKRYFDAIRAPRKEYFLLPRTGHDPNPVMIEAQFNILKTRVFPLVN
jgi:pimeloyl-ACP methyl ester carboxylesterase